MADSIQRDGKEITSSTEASKVMECAKVNAVITLSANNAAALVPWLSVSGVPQHQPREQKCQKKQQMVWAAPDMPGTFVGEQSDGGPAFGVA